MLSFFKKLFQKEEINKEKDLITTLKNDHQKLIEIYQEIHTFINKNDFIQAQSSLKKFIATYNKHILLEDTKLYIALSEKYQDKKQILKTIKNIEKDMNAITRSITFFEKKYHTISNNNKDLFISELSDIGQILLERVELEEERLYTLL